MHYMPAFQCCPLITERWHIKIGKDSWKKKTKGHWRNGSLSQSRYQKWPCQLASSARKRADLGGIAEDERSQVQNQQKKVVFIHTVVDLWNSGLNNVVLIHNSTRVTRENVQALKRKILRRKTHYRPLNGQNTSGSRHSWSWI